MTTFQPTVEDPGELTLGGSSRASRPGLGERTAALATIVFLIVGLPLDWFNPPPRGAQLVGGESPLVIVAFLGLAGTVFYFMAGNWHILVRVSLRSPLVVALHFLMVASSFWSVSPGTSFRRSVAISLAAVIAVYLLTRFTQLELFRMLAWAMLIAVVLNLLFFFGFPDLARTFERRSGNMVITGVFSNKNSFGQMAILAVFTFAVAIRADRRFRLLWLASMLLGIVLVVLSQSKTSLATAGLGVVLLAFYQVFRARKTMFGAVTLLVLGASALSIAFTVANIEFLSGLLGRDATISGRMPLWESVIDSFDDRLLFGHGWAAFWNGFFSPAHELYIQNSWLPPSAHNGFLDLITQLGFVGFGVGAMMFLVGLRRGTVHAQNIPGIFGLWPLGVISIAVVYSMSESSLIGRHIFWVLTVMALVVVDQPTRTLSLPTAARRRMLVAASKRVENQQIGA
ncbi:MAG: O-antigen ligase family protein [Acidimicrobiia bacterium]|nr:O-antigen ligase family protein [Acidimicrobiia bacterium]